MTGCDNCVMQKSWWNVCVLPRGTRIYLESFWLFVWTLLKSSVLFTSRYLIVRYRISDSQSFLIVGQQKQSSKNTKLETWELVTSAGALPSLWSEHYLYWVSTLTTSFRNRWITVTCLRFTSAWGSSVWIIECDCKQSNTTVTETSLPNKIGRATKTLCMVLWMACVNALKRFLIDQTFYFQLILTV